MVLKQVFEDLSSLPIDPAAPVTNATLSFIPGPSNFSLGGTIFRNNKSSKDIRFNESNFSFPPFKL